MVHNFKSYILLRLLPKDSEYLYTVYIKNPAPKLVGIHTKKTLVASSLKIVTGEVPDHIKSMLGTDKVRRVARSGIGNCLLESCDVNIESMRVYARDNYKKYLDIQPLEIEEIDKNIVVGNMDHRIYGKMIEDFTNYNVIVFDNDGLVPYRYSKCSKENSILLFISKSNTYSRISIENPANIISNIQRLRDIYNLSTLTMKQDIIFSSGRKIDYVLACIKIASYVAVWAKDNQIYVVCTIIPEDKCKEIVEQVYSNVTYHEGWTRNNNSKYDTRFTKTRRLDSRVLVTPDIILKCVYGVVTNCDTKQVSILCPVDITKYHPFNLTLESCLYESPNCYKLERDEEIQCCRL